MVNVSRCPSAGRTPQGVRGLKSYDDVSIAALSGRTPQGVRGLKYEFANVLCAGGCVAPRKGCVD